MPPPTRSRSARLILDAACAGALAAARWDKADLSTRKPGADGRALLLAKAAECALSPLARDQLLSLAIERTVDDGDSGAPLLNGPGDPGERAEIGKQVFASGPHKASETEALVEAMESRHARRVRGGAQLAAQLRQDAVLHELLWDHPGIPAGHRIRLAMLCAIPRLRDRADELTTGGPGWFRGLMRMAGYGRAG